MLSLLVENNFRSSYFLSTENRNVNTTISMSKIIVDVSFESEVLDLIRWREVGGDENEGGIKFDF